jgi:hypothetical protein
LLEHLNIIPEISSVNNIEVVQPAVVVTQTKRGRVRSPKNRAQKEEISPVRKSTRTKKYHS